MNNEQISNNKVQSSSESSSSESDSDEDYEEGNQKDRVKPTDEADDSDDSDDADEDEDDDDYDGDDNEIEIDDRTKGKQKEIDVIDDLINKCECHSQVAILYLLFNWKLIDFFVVSITPVEEDFPNRATPDVELLFAQNYRYMIPILIILFSVLALLVLVVKMVVVMKHRRGERYRQALLASKNSIIYQKLSEEINTPQTPKFHRYSPISQV